MKYMLGILLILVCGLAACAQPPESVPAAEIVEEKDDMAHDDMKDDMADDMKDDAMADDEMSDDMKDEAMADDMKDNMSDDMEESMKDNMSDDMQDAMAKDNMSDDMIKTAGGEVVSINIDASSFEFEGYAIGKSHVGSFDEMEGTFTVDDSGAIVAATGIIQAASVNTGIGGLDDHLKADDFFDVEQFPEIVIESTALAQDSVSGLLTFHGVTHEVSFPANVTAQGISADFLLDTEPFGMTNTGVNKEVRITFNLVI